MCYFLWPNPVLTVYHITRSRRSYHGTRTADAFLAVAAGHRNPNDFLGFSSVRFMVKCKQKKNSGSGSENVDSRCCRGNCPVKRPAGSIFNTVQKQVNIKTLFLNLESRSVEAYTNPIVSVIVRYE